MKKLSLLVFTSLIFLIPAKSFSQNTIAVPADPKKSAILFTVGNEAVTAGEFLNVYQRNNNAREVSYSEKDLRNYLDLYINFRLKVKEAREMRLDTVSAVKKELITYRKQLAKSYLTDKEITDKLLKESYDRLSKEVRAKHILVQVGPDAVPEDTLKAYRKISDIRKRIMKGEDFSKVAMEVSEDPSAKDNGGDIGYFSAFRVVYPFETAAYNTPKGTVSMPVRTRFGYHLVKVEDIRAARPQIQIAQIFLRSPKNAPTAPDSIVKQKINDIYNRLKKGESFEDLAKQFSEDKTTSASGGKLQNWIIPGTKAENFENAAYGIKEKGGFSEPVKTEVGWHIIKLLDKKELLPYEDMKEELKKRVEQDERSAKSQDQFLKKIQKENKFKEDPAAKAALLAKLDSSIYKNTWKASVASSLNKPIFTLGNTAYVQSDFASFIEKNQRKHKGTLASVYNNLYKDFVNKSTLDFEEARLETKYPAFSALMKEYEDGILLFELTDKKVWSKAVQDSIGLQKFYETRVDSYMWDDRIRLATYTVKDKQTADKLRMLLSSKNEWKKEDLKMMLSNNPPMIVKSKEKKGKKKAIVSDTVTVVSPDVFLVTEDEKTFEKGQNAIADQILWKVGLSNDIVNPDGTITIAKVTGLFEPAPKKLSEAKGYVVADYQQHLEKAWIEDLKKKYPVKINESVFKSLVK